MRQFFTFLGLLFLVSCAIKQSENNPVAQLPIPGQSADTLQDIPLVPKVEAKEVQQTDSIDLQIEDLRKEIDNASIVRVGNDIKITFSSQILFAVNSDVLSPQAKNALKGLAEIVSQYKGTEVEVAGHTDNSGSEQYNYSLSKRRAAAVARYTAKNGVDATRFRIKGFGESMPIASNQTKEGRQMNRRVEISIKGNTLHNKDIANAFEAAKDSCGCNYDEYNNYICKRVCDAWIKIEGISLSKDAHIYLETKGLSLLVKEKEAEAAQSIQTEKSILNAKNLNKLLEESDMVVMAGKVVNKNNREPTRAKVRVTLLDTGELVDEVEADSVTGNYSLLLEKGKHYAIGVEKKGYLLSEENIRVGDRQDFKLIRQDLQLTPLQTGQKMNLNNVFFERSKAVLLKSSLQQLKEVVKMMQLNPSMRVELHGHTDGIGDPDLNFKLSQARANAIKEYLISEGIVGSRITTKAFGGTQPIASNKFEATRKLNRRVEFVIAHL